MVELTDLINGKSFFLIAGPCAVESKSVCEEIAGHIKEITTKLNIPYLFKASYRKANRSKLSSFQGIGDDIAIDVLQHIKTHFDLPITTDIHTAEEAVRASAVADVLQIPAFLCRQTDLLVAAGNTNKIVNIKKGQFMSASNMKYAVEKIAKPQKQNVWLTERGNTFGYQDLVVDYRNIPWMQEIGVPVILDCTHSLQLPNQVGGVTGGNPKMIGTIAKAGIAVGVDGLFIETHPNPSKALSDGANMLPLHELEPLLNKLVDIRAVVAN